MIDYSYYINEFHGSIIPENTFPDVVRRNMLLLKHLSSNKITDSFETDYPEYAKDIKDALCIGMETMYQREVETYEHGGREVKSESNDGYNVSFVTEGIDGMASRIEGRVSKILKWYLSHTGLLYRGN